MPPELDKNLVAIEAGEAPEAAKPEVADIPPPQQDDKDKKDEKEESSKKDDDKDNKKDEPVKDTKHEVSQLLASAVADQSQTSTSAKIAVTNYTLIIHSLIQNT